MKKLFALLMVFVLMLSLCSCKINQKNSATKESQPSESDYQLVTEINHYVVEPDDKLHMTDEDEMLYEKLMDAMLSQKGSVTLSDNISKNEYYIDLLKQSPYFFFIEEYELNNNKVDFSYKYKAEKQDEILCFMDEKFLDVVNTHAHEDNNTLDTILNIYGAVAHAMTYDHERKDNKELGSPLFQYPSDEIYKALKNKKSLCYGFAYTLRFALLQVGVDCFCVYGPCRNQGEAHMWNIFKYDGKFYTCDSAWDRSDGEYAQLNHFGKTEKERKVDSLEISGYSSTLFEEYGKIECIDETFKMFRKVNRYSYYSPHTYYLSDFEGNEYIFDTETLEMK